VTASYLWCDQREQQYDELFNYHLPYAKSASWRVSQGYNGSSTHKNTYAIDFTMPIGTAIHASRSGTVIQVKENEAIGCNALKCLEKANFIRILHQDGTIAEYTHLCYFKSAGRKSQLSQTLKAGFQCGIGGVSRFRKSEIIPYHLQFKILIFEQRFMKWI
jgi:hypothetical protein